LQFVAQSFQSHIDGAEPGANADIATEIFQHRVKQPRRNVLLRYQSESGR